MGFRQLQVRGCSLQPPMVQLACGVSQRQVRMIGRRALGKRLEHRVDRSRLPVEHPTERVVSDEAGGIGPVAGREHVPHRLDDLAVVGEPPGGPAVEVGNLVGKSSAELEVQEIRQQVVVAKPRARRVDATRRTRWHPRVPTASAPSPRGPPAGRRAHRLSVRRSTSATACAEPRSTGVRASRPSGIPQSPGRCPRTQPRKAQDSRDG